MRQATGVSKAAYVVEFVRLLLDSEDRVVVFAWHHAVYEVWMESLKDLRPVRYTGEEAVQQKEEARRLFCGNESDVMIMSLRSGAGVDGLQFACATIVFGELDWSPAVHEQAIGRVHRDGQARPCMAYYCVADDGADPVMVDALALKEQQSSRLRGQDRESIFGDVKAGENHLRKLAESLLKKKNRG
jgi:SNF2 family DNA or RNA helicase